MPDSVVFDRFDRALLDLVRIDNQTPARVLAAQIGLSESAVLRRLRRLRKDRVIVADVAVVDPDVLGKPLTLHVLVSLEREGSIQLDAFIRKLRLRQEVVVAWYVTGEVDFVLQLQLSGMDVYETFCGEVFHEDPNVKSFKTIVAMREVIGQGRRAVRAG